MSLPIKRTRAAGVFSESTLIPVSFITTIVGVCFWVGSLSARVDAHGEDVAALQAKNQRWDAIIAEHERQANQFTADLGGRISALDAKISFIYDYVRERRGKK